MRETFRTEPLKGVVSLEQRHAPDQPHPEPEASDKSTTSKARLLGTKEVVYPENMCVTTARVHSDVRNRESRFEFRRRRLS